MLLHLLYSLSCENFFFDEGDAGLNSSVKIFLWPSYSCENAPTCNLHIVLGSLVAPYLGC